MASKILLPAYKGQTLLIVATIHLTQAQIKSFEQQLAKLLEEKAGAWTPVFQTLSERRAECETSGDLHTIAMRAKTLGWKKFFVLDSSSRRLLGSQKLCDEPWETDGEENFGVVIETNYKGPAGSLSAKMLTNAGSDCIFAWRSSVPAAIEHIISDESYERPDIATYARQGNSSTWRFENYHNGFELLSPFKPLVPASSVKAVMQESAKNNKDLEAVSHTLEIIANSMPLEVRSQIADFAEIEEPNSIDDLTEAPKALEWMPQILHVHLLARVSGDELQKLNAQLQAAVAKSSNQGATCNVYEWKGLEPATFGDIWRLFSRLVVENTWLVEHVYLAFLYPTEWSEEQPKLQLIDSFDPFYPSVRPITIATALEIIKTYNQQKRVDERPNFSRDVSYSDIQQFVFPSYPFYPFQPWPTFLDSNAHKDIICYHLVDTITAEDVNYLDEELRKSVTYPETEDQILSHVPWKSDIPGGDDDVWRLLYHSYAWAIAQGQGSNMAVFIPESFHLDKKIWIAEFDRKYAGLDEVLYSTCNIRGAYNATVEPKEILSMWINLEISNIDMKNFDTSYHIPNPAYTPSEEDEMDWGEFYEYEEGEDVEESGENGGSEDNEEHEESKDNEEQGDDEGEGEYEEGEEKRTDYN